MLKWNEIRNAILVVLILAVLSLRASASNVTLTASKSTVALNESFTVTVGLQNAAPFANWGLCLNYDKSRLQLTGQAAGTLAHFVPDSRTAAAIQASGEARTGGWNLTNNAGGNGTLAVFTFKAIALGSAQVLVENSSGSNPFGNILYPISGSGVLPNLPPVLLIQINGPGGGQGKRDFNGDGKSDVLLRHSSSGDVILWLMNGTSISGE